MVTNPSSDVRCQCGATSLMILFPGNPKPVPALNVKSGDVTHTVERCGVAKQSKK